MIISYQDLVKNVFYEQKIENNIHIHVIWSMVKKRGQWHIHSTIINGEVTERVTRHQFFYI